MTDSRNDLQSSVDKSTRLALICAGVLGILFGLAILIWPTKAVVAVTVIIAIYAVIAGIVAIVTGIVSKALGTGGRIGSVLLGLLYLVAGILAFTELKQTAAFLVVFVSVLLGFLWIMEGFTSLFSLGDASSKGWTIAFAIISIIAGISLITSPLWTGLFLWALMGIAMVVIGVLNVVRAVRRDPAKA